MLKYLKGSVAKNISCTAALCKPKNFQLPRPFVEKDVTSKSNDYVTKVNYSIENSILAYRVKTTPTKAELFFDKQTERKDNLKEVKHEQQQLDVFISYKHIRKSDEQQQKIYSEQPKASSLFSFVLNLNGSGCKLFTSHIDIFEHFVGITNIQALGNQKDVNATNKLNSHNNNKWQIITKPSQSATLTLSSLSESFLKNSQNLDLQRRQHIRLFHTNLCQQNKQTSTRIPMSTLAAEPKSNVSKDDVEQNLQTRNSSSSNNTNGPADSKVDSGPSCSTNESKSSSVSEKSSLSSGMPELVKFMELIGKLKHTKRTGWVLRNVDDCESISGHMYRMSILTFLLDGSEGLNQIRCMELALVHDMAESLVGDITPFCGITKEEKRELEFKAMEDICNLIQPRGKRIMELFEEYEKGESPESKFVKDLDRLDMVMQAFEYEKRDNCLLKHQEFFDSTEGKFNHPFVKDLISEIYAERKLLAKNQGATMPESVLVPTMESCPSLPTKNPPVTNGFSKTTMTKNQND